MSGAAHYGSHVSPQKLRIMKKNLLILTGAIAFTVCAYAGVRCFFCKGTGYSSGGVFTCAHCGGKGYTN